MGKVPLLRIGICAQPRDQLRLRDRLLHAAVHIAQRDRLLLDLIITDYCYPAVAVFVRRAQLCFYTATAVVCGRNQAGLPDFLQQFEGIWPRSVVNLDYV